MHDLTAAHRTLPLGTRVLVINLDNGEAVEVRINDRGPFGRDRILDLSYAAARVLGAVGSGIIRVRLSVVARSPTASPDGAARFAIQVGAFTTRERAEAIVRTLANDEMQAAVAPAKAGEEIYYRVRVGNYADRQSAQQTAARLASRGYRTVIVER
jgi:rare lipoprotein A